MFGRLKLDKADIVFSQAIRYRDGWRCQLCERQFHPGDRGIECSHFFGRRKESVRFEPDNCDSFCTKCHMEMEHEKGWTEGIVDGEKVRLPKKYRAWKTDQLGETRFKILEINANMYVKKDRKLALLVAQEFLKQSQTDCGRKVTGGGQSRSEPRGLR